MYAIYKVNLKEDTSSQRPYGSLESQTMVYLAPSIRKAYEFFCDTDLVFESEANDITLGNIQYIEDGDYVYYMEQVR